MNLEDIATITNATLMGKSKEIRALNIDTRTLQAGDVYVALRGESLDGHQFVVEAKERGAAAAIVDHVMDLDLPQIIVENTEQALQQLAAHHRQQMAVKAIAVTGSCGKTTTRAFLQHIFEQAGSTHASVGSFNNHVGVPLTLLQLKPVHQFLVSEVGANHMGEIAQLIPLVQPDVAIITNIAPVHVEGFGSLDNISRAKAEIYSGLSADGCAVVNHDDHYADFLKSVNHNHRVVTFGIKHPSDVMATDLHFDARGLASFQLLLPHHQPESIQLRLFGEHNIYNALAAAAAGYALGLTIEQIKRGLEHTEAVHGRLVEKQLANGAVVIDDSYNANPLATKAALNILVNRSGERIFVFGDMKELGADAKSIHADIGCYAKALGIEHVFCYGELTQETVAAFGQGAIHFRDRQQLIDALVSMLKSDQTILVKGSHSMRMDIVVNALLGE